MTKYKKPAKRDWIRIIVYIAVFVGVITIGAIFLLPTYFYIWLILVIGGLLLFVRWHVKNFAYRCLRCGHEFEISIFIYFISPHGPGWKYLKCPKCHERSRATMIKRIEKS